MDHKPLTLGNLVKRFKGNAEDRRKALALAENNPAYRRYLSFVINDDSKAVIERKFVLGPMNRSEEKSPMTYEQLDEWIDEMRNWYDNRKEYLEEKARKEAAQAEQERWDSQAFEVSPRPASGWRGKYTNSLVWLYHGTTDRVLHEIMSNGLRVDAKAAWENTTKGYIYLTRCAYTARNTYAKKAASMMGGDPAVLKLILLWNDLLPDRDDRDLGCGKDQFRLKGSIPSRLIFEVDGKRVRDVITEEDLHQGLHLYSMMPKTPGKWFGR